MEIKTSFFLGCVLFLVPHLNAETVDFPTQDTLIKGGKMELRNKGEEVVFSQGVRLEQGTDVITANEMRTNQNRDKITATGRVKLFRKVSSTENWKGWGEKGFFESNAGSGYLLGGRERASLLKTEILSSTSTRVLQVWGDRIDFYRDTNLTQVTGRVEGKTQDPATSNRYEFYASTAVYDSRAKLFILTSENKSHIREIGPKTKRDVYGRIITYYVETGRLVSQDQAQAILENQTEGK